MFLKNDVRVGRKSCILLNCLSYNVSLNLIYIMVAKTSEIIMFN
jgi:hypothetical protein